MPSLDPFISRNDLGDYLGRDLSTDQAALIVVDAACDTVRTIAEQSFNLVEDDEIALDGTGTDSLLLPELPIVEVSDVTQDGTTLTAEDDYRLSSNGVLFRMPSVVENGTILTLRRGWKAGRQNINVTYTHGYAPAELPRDVRMVALSLADRLFEQQAAVFESLGSHSWRFDGPATNLTAGELMILRKYRQTR